MQSTAIQQVAPEVEILTISSQTHQGTKELLRLLRQKVEDWRKREASLLEEEADGATDDIPVISMSGDQLSESWSVEREPDGYRVRGDKIEKFARRTNFDNFEAVNRLRNIMQKMGINHELRRKGADGDSLIRIGEIEFYLVEQQ